MKSHLWVHQLVLPIIYENTANKIPRMYYVYLIISLTPIYPKDNIIKWSFLHSFLSILRGIFDWFPSWSNALKWGSMLLLLNYIRIYAPSVASASRVSTIFAISLTLEGSNSKYIPYITIYNFKFSPPLIITPKPRFDAHASL